MSSYIKNNSSNVSKSSNVPEHLRQALVNVNTGDNHVIPQSQSDTGKKILGGKRFIDVYTTNLSKIRKAWHEAVFSYILNTPKLKLEADSKYSKRVGWYPSDDEEGFIKNTQDETSKKLMYKLGWTDAQGKTKDLWYNLNEFGFRCVNFSTADRPGIVTLGCSFTFGVGISNKDTFAQKVASHYGLENYNLGTPGRGLDFLSIYVSLFLEHELNPELIKAVVVYLPPAGRETIFHYNDGDLQTAEMHNDVMAPTNWYQGKPLKNLVPVNSEVADRFNLYDTEDKVEIQQKLDDGLSKYIDQYRSTLWEHLMMTKENHFKRDMFSLNTIKLFCLEKNIPLVIATQSSPIATTIDFARDLMHFGPKTHSNIAHDIISQLNIHLS